MGDPKSDAFPLQFRGVVQRTDPGALQNGEFQNASNITSNQEGSITARYGSKKYANNQAITVVHGMTKLALGGADSADPRYLQDGANVWRVLGPYTLSTNISASLGLAAVRFEARAFDAAGSGKPIMYFAHPTRMMRDDGGFAKLRPWGILPPVQPVIAALANPLLSNYPGFVLLTSQSAGSARLSAPTVSSATVINTNYYKITPSSMAGIYPGMYVQIASPGFVLVDNVDATSFYAYASSTPSGAIAAFSNPVDKDSGGGTVASLIADGSNYHGDFSASVDWSFQGNPLDGYDSDDLVHVGLFISDLADVKEVRFRIFVNGSTTDYYEKALAIPQIQAFSESTDTASETQQSRADLITSGALGEVGFPDPITIGLQPIEIPPTPVATWHEYDIPKSSFLRNGNAGTGANSWKNVSKFQVFVISNEISGLPTFNVLVGAIYAAGGQGPDSETIPTSEPYDYLYTYRDPLTNARGNPCVAMVEEKFIHTQNRAVQITLTGCDTDAVTGNPAISGYGSIAVYRRGGVFADGIYRFIGYTTNPGASSTVLFVDNFPDDAISGNDAIEFDNYPPVPSSPQVPFSGTINTVSGSSGALVNIVLQDYPNYGSNPALTTFFTVGSLIRIGKGTNQEQCLIQAIGSSRDITVWLQRVHYTGEQVFCEQMIGQPCDIVCQAGESLLVAGDPNNPHKIYRSKAGRPHAFPIINLASGNSHIAIAGAPDNPVNGIAPYSGEYVSLNLQGLYVFNIWQGQMTQPVRIPGTRGMVGKHLWCEVQGEIWYLSFDGIYAFGGGASRKVTGAIDWVFQKQSVGSLIPLDFAQLDFVQLAYFQGTVWFLYKDTTGANTGFRYDLAHNRWEPIVYRSAAFVGALTCLLVEEDTGRLIGSVFSNAASQSFLHLMESGTSEGWTSAVNDGTKIDFSAKTGFYSPEGRLTQVLLQDIVIELQNPSDAVTVKVYYDFSDTADAVDQFTIASGAARRRVPLPMQVVSGYTLGKECNSFAVEFSGSSNGAVTFHSVGYRATPLAQIQRGLINDWSDLGHPFDKRLYECTIEFDTKGQAVTLHLDLTGGVDGNSPTLAVQDLVLPATSGRGKKTFGLTDGEICKLVRLRPNTTSADFEIFSVAWVKENYPADIVRFTEYTDDGNPYDKYWQQLLLDVNTNGQIVPVSFEIDGASQAALNFQSTLATRNQNKTLTPALYGKKARLVVGSIPAGGMFQLFSHKWITQPGDKGPVAHSFDWDDLGHPFDKKLRTVTVEYDNQSVGPITLIVDTLTGIDGATPNLSAFTLSLAGSGRGKKTFPIADGQIVKMVRIHPSSDNVLFKMWGYKFDFDPYPADSIAWTPWEDFGYEHLKIIQEIAFDVDTGGVAASVAIQSDGGTVQTISVNTSTNNREFIYTLDPELTGKKFRLLITPGGGGKFQLWKWVPKFLKGDPGPVEHSFDWDDLGYPYDKRLINVTFEYDTGGVSTTMLMDTITGVNGTTQTSAVQSFVLSGSGRSKQTFTIAIDTMVKMVRIRPSSTFAALRVWKYQFNKNDLPPDTIAATEWSDIGYPCEKVLRGFEIDIDTGGVACSLQLQMDGANIGSPYSVTTTSTNRVVILTVGSDVIGKIFRLVPTPGSGGKAQIFNVVYDGWREPCYRSHVSTSEIVLGHASWKFMKQMWIEYICASQITVSIYRENKTLFYQKVLPVHAHRDIENFLIPDAVGVVLNKSRSYRIEIDSASASNPMKLYVDGSRFEIMQLANDQRACFEQHQLSMFTNTVVGQPSG